MKIAGVVAEYNPFHNGHKHQLLDLRRQSECDYLIVIMSGNFAQRGEPTIADKRLRASWALNNGADLVIELPVYYAVANAECFAYGAVSTLNACGISALGFGCETDDLELLRAAARLYHNDDEKLSSLIQAQLSLGLSYPAAVHKALIQYGASDELVDLIEKPNAILGIEYLKELEKVSSNAQVFLTKRIGTGHDSKIASENFASASYIRTNLNEWERYVPNGVILANAPVYDKHFSDLILYKLSTMTDDELLSLPDVSEGLHNLLRYYAKIASSYYEFLESVKSKRYTMARIKRICMCALLGIKAEYQKTPPKYIHVLGVRKESKSLLSHLSNNASLPVIIKGTDSEQLSDEAKRMFDLDVSASNTYALVAKTQRLSDYFSEFLVV